MLDAENPAEQDAGTAGTEAAPAGPTGTDGAGTPAKKAAKKAPAKKATAKKAATKRAPVKRTTTTVAGPAAESSSAEASTPTGGQSPESGSGSAADAPAADSAAEAAPAKKTAKKSAAKKSATKATATKATAKKAATKKTAAKKTTKKAAAGTSEGAADPGATSPQAAVESSAPEAGAEPTTPEAGAESSAPEAGAEPTAPAAPSVTAPLFQPPDPTKAVTRKRTTKKKTAPADDETASQVDDSGQGAPDEQSGNRPPRRPTKKTAAKKSEGSSDTQADEDARPGDVQAEGDDEGDNADEQSGERRRRRRGGRRRRRSGGGDNDSDGGSQSDGDSQSEQDKDEDDSSDGKGGQGSKGGKGKGGNAGKGRDAEEDSDDDSDDSGSGTRRRRRRRRSGEGGDSSDGDDGGSSRSEGGSGRSGSRARKPRNAEDEITALSGSTRLEAKKQRRREGREAGRRRAPIVSEAEFLARRESVDRVMVIRQRKDLTQIAVLEDKVLVEHYVARESQTSLIGNVYLGRVQNVLPSMEAAFIDIGKGRNAVLYAGEVNWDALGAKNGTPRKIEAVLKSGQPILVQVTKDPIGHKGARLTSQVSLPGRFLVYVPDGTTSGISRKLPDTERNRLKTLLKDIVPESAGVIVRTAAEGASEDELTRDVERLTARWGDIEAKVQGGNAPQLLYGEPDLTLKVVRDLFTEDFSKLVISGTDAWDLVDGYVSHVAPDLADRLERYDAERDVFAEYRIDEQIEKALDRKVWLPSGGSLVIDRTEAMTVVDVNTGKFTGSGGNLEETVTKNNLEAAEEIIRQLRLRDIGGIIVVDFIDMVLESNRDLVLRRMIECLGRDRTRHQVAEVTSLGLVQMTRKRIGTGLLEAFSESCEHCQGRGLVLHHEPIEARRRADDDTARRSGGRGRGGRSRGRDDESSTRSGGSGGGAVPSPKDIAAMARHEDRPADRSAEDEPVGQTTGAPGTQEEPAPATDEPSTRSDKTPDAGLDDGPGDSAGDGTPRRSRSRGGRGRGRETAADRSQDESTGVPQAGSDAPEEGGRDTDRAAVPAAEAAGDGSGGSDAARDDKPTAQPVRRRSTRQSGPPPSTSSDDAVISTGTEAQSPAAPAEPTAPAEVEQPSEPAAPKIVTSVRRRSARRPAGPPSGVGAPAAVPVDGEAADSPPPAEPPSSDGAPTEPGTPHVPVKKRSRRR